eukprot:m.319940 g.319940  ORF g.319940 m.319940 type:complete len:117 (+) comp23583_c0_seq1:111-461(+)
MSALKQKVHDAKLKTACCCCFLSCCYFERDCIGCESISSCLCCREEAKCSIFETSLKQTCCKGPHDGKVCGNNCFTCCKGVSQCCCFLEACALPTDNEVPCMVGICGFMCIGNPKK